MWPRLSATRPRVATHKNIHFHNAQLQPSPATFRHHWPLLLLTWIHSINYPLTQPSESFKTTLFIASDQSYTGMSFILVHGIHVANVSLAVQLVAACSLRSLSRLHLSFHHSASVSLCRPLRSIPMWPTPPSSSLRAYELLRYVLSLSPFQTILTYTDTASSSARPPSHVNRVPVSD